MAALLATVLPEEVIFGPSVAAVRGDTAPLFCSRWIRDAEDGALVCAWTSDPEQKKPNLHLRLVPA